MQGKYFIYVLSAILGVATIVVMVYSVQDEEITIVDVDILQGAASPVLEESLSPETVHVVIGINNTIRWNNIDNAPHTLTPNHAYDGFPVGTGLLRPGESTTITFELPGVYDYHGTPGPWITGTVIVSEHDLDTFHCDDWCDQKELDNLGCNALILNHLYKYSNLLDEEFDGMYYLDLIGLPEGISEEKFEKCMDFIYEKRTSMTTDGISE